MAQLYKPTESIATFRGKTYKTVMNNKKDKTLENKPNFDFMRKVDRNIYIYYYECTKKEYKEHHQAMRDELFVDTHNKYYNLLDESEQNIDIDNLNDDLAIDEYLQGKDEDC